MPLGKQKSKQRFLIMNTNIRKYILSETFTVANVKSYF